MDNDCQTDRQVMWHELISLRQPISPDLFTDWQFVVEEYCQRTCVLETC